MSQSNTSHETQKKRIQEVTERLEAGIKDFLSSEKYQDYLKVMSRFHNYSYSNSILIAMQKPDASLVAGYTTWDRKFERHPKKGSHGIKIFAPAPVATNTFVEREKIDPVTKLPVLDENGDPVMESIAIKRPAFKVVTVFDVSDTEGKPLQELDIPQLNGDVQQYDTLMDAICRTSTVPIEFESITSGANGYFSLTDKRIVINEGMSELQTIKTAIHELAHSRLHDIDITKPIRKLPAQKDKATKEVEAESVAFVVSEHFGLDTSDYSFGYIGTWSSDRSLPELKASLQTIHDASTSIITDLEKHLSELHIEHQTEQSRESSFDKKNWRCYIIPDLMTWTGHNTEKARTPIEYFDTFEEAANRFQELRRQPYNAESAINESNLLPYSRLTFGIQREEPPSAADLLHVQNGKNVLLEDFTKMDALRSDTRVLEILSRLGSEIGFDQVLVHRDMTTEEIKAFTRNHYSDKIQQSELTPAQQQQYMNAFDELYEQGQMDHMKPSSHQQSITELQAFSSWHNPYFNVTDTPQRLAADIEVFAYEFDPYEYADNTAEESIFPQIFNSILNQDASDIISWLKDIEEEEDSEYSEQASELLQRLESMTTVPERETVLQIGSRYLHIQSASDESWDYSIYDRNLNLIDGGQIGEKSMTLAEAQNEIMKSYDFSISESPTRINPDHFSEMLEAYEHNLKCPLCPLTLVEARKQGTMDEWRICHNANEACATQFSKEYSLAYHNHQVPEFLSKMVERYGMDRCKFVLAGTIQLAPWDKRYHTEIREAANQIKIPGASADPNHDTRLHYLVNCHPVMIDVAFRDLMAMEEKSKNVSRQEDSLIQNQNRSKGDRPSKGGKKQRSSVLKKLKAKQAELSSEESSSQTPVKSKPQL